MNENFSTIYAAACNRGGCTMTGSFAGTSGTFSSTLGVTGATTVGSTLAVTGAATLTSTLAVNSTSAAAIDVAGGITAGSGNVAIVDTTGKIPAISSTYFASLSGANLTSIPETAITDGSLLARRQDAETISGAWTFSSTLTTAGISATSITGTTINATGLITASAAGGTINIRPSAGSDGYLTFTEDAVSDRWAIGIDDADGTLRLRQTNSTGTTTTSWSAAGNLTHAFGLALSGEISPSALSSGNNNNYNPTGLSTATVLRLTTDAGGSTLTGIAAQGNGTVIAVCHVAGAGSLTIAANSGSSSAANRFLGTGFTVSAGDCPPFRYDGTSQGWRLWGSVY